ncbi:FtsX-like permease family protein [Kitasatospora sp. NPDC051853]|uniref:FtsX-like permease family protein n=1 Tax=Kitasatospora sp. NPDC051853 TaxID=3364058 RepID=UPI0037B7810D
MASLGRYTVKEFLGQARQLVLTGVAVAVGVAFLVLSVGASGALVDSFSQTAATEVGPGAVQVTAAAGRAREGLPADAARRAAQVPGVVSVAERLAGTGTVLTASGRPLDEATVVTSVAADPALRWQRLARGAWPSRDGELLLDEGTAEDLGVAPGGQVTVLRADGSTGRAVLTGLLETSGSPTLSGHPVLGLPHDAAAAWASRLTVTQLDLAAAPGAAPATVAEAVGRALGDGVTARTRAASVEEARSSTGAMYSVVLAAALSFVLIALAVARMVVTNTFSVVLAQRARQLALLRCVGASQRQVRRMILLQGLMLGVLASAAGLVAGGLACLLGTGVLALVDLGPVSVSLLPSWPVFLTAGLFGLALTALAVRRPARLASAVPPVAALSESGAALPDLGNKVVRGAVSALLLGFGALMLVIGGQGGSAAALLAVTVGAVSSFFGVLRLARFLLPPVVSLLGLPARRAFGTTGRLAAQQLRSNPGRTGSAASALLVGVTVAVSAATALSVAGGSLEGMLSARHPGAFALATEDGRLPAGALAALERRPELTVTPVRTATVRLDGRPTVVAAADPARLNGSAEGVDEARALRDGEALATGRAVALRLPDGTVWQTRTGPSALPHALLPEATVYVTPATLAAAAPDAAVATAWISATGSTDRDGARRAVDEALAGFPGVRVTDSASEAAYVRDVLDTMMLVSTVLLGFSMVIAAIGVAATLTLSVDERTRELGMLRAIGLTGDQLRSLLTLEAALLALGGAVAGTVLGGVYGVLAARSVTGEGLSLAFLPYGTVALLLAAAGLLGVAASVLPARRVRRMRIVQALHAA